MPAFVKTLLQAVIGLAIVGLIWVIAAPVIGDPVRLPPLGPVIAKAVELASSADYHRHIEESGTALVLGLAPALLAGIVLGVIARLSSSMRWLIGPIASALAAAPLGTPVPVVVLGWGLTSHAKAAAVFVVAVFPIMNMLMVSPPTNHRVSLNSREMEYEKPLPETGKATVRAIFCGLRLGVMFGMSALIVCEFMASTRGVGYFIMN